MLSTKASFALSIIFVISLPWAFGKLNKYCSICDNHTMCKYQNVGPDCEDVGGYGVTVDEKLEILDVHNWYRRVVAGGYETTGAGGPQPKGANIMKLAWDEDLAQVAQRWADQCRLEHDTCRDDARWKVGQNIYWKWKYPNHNVNWTEAITSWYNEVTTFNPKNIKSYRFDANTGHYTQMLWHDTRLIGCGRRDYGYNKLYVCNYGPTGNWIGEPMYAIGEPCSQCPKGTVCSDSLCDIPPPGTDNGAVHANVTQEDPTSDKNSKPKIEIPTVSSTPKRNCSNTTKPKQDVSNAPKTTPRVTVGQRPISTTKTNSTQIVTSPKTEPVEDNIILDQETNSAIEEIKLKIKTLVKKVIKKTLRNANNKNS
ncbi:hypothetical protein RUM44_012271 [Polyplax serrata]|uniref:SCP domain-containing protein n=1 Tax=Polyplax serrata TaxID=468196 RepID=A0ABR1BAT9_POLSC